MGKEFALHEVAVALVADSRSEAHDHVKRALKHHALSGNGNVLKWMKQSSEKAGGGWAIGVLDGDQLPRLIRDQSGGRRPVSSELESELHGLMPSVGQRSFVIIVKNTETVIEEAIKALPAIDPVVAARAASKAGTNERDIVLNKLARCPDPSVRARVCERVAGLALLRDRILCALSGT
jgi:hypothetical protein